MNESFSMIARHEKKGGPVSRGSALCGVAEQVAAVTVLNRLRMNGKNALKKLKRVQIQENLSEMNVIPSNFIFSLWSIMRGSAFSR